MRERERHFFPSLACNLLSVDAVDATGKAQEDAHHEIYKHRLGPQGERLSTGEGGNGERVLLGETLRTEEQLESAARERVEREQAVIKEQIGSCGNCYGAGKPGQCCQTCQDVQDAYARVGWRFKPQGVLQCQSEAMRTNLREQFAEDGGCQVYGRLRLNKAKGHFHIAPHRKIHAPPAMNGNNNNNAIFNLMDLIAFTFDQFNVSHTINSLSFGAQYPGLPSALDGQTRVVADTHGMYQYYLHVVPTRYVGPETAAAETGADTLTGTGAPREREVESNQYAVTEHLSHLAPGSGRGLPGVYFYYEVSPVHARVETKRKQRTRARGLLALVTSVCAIVGGAYSVMGLVDIALSAVSAWFGNKALL